MAKYKKNEAKEWALENVKGIYITMCTAERFDEDTKEFVLSEQDIRNDVNHLINVCKVSGFFLMGLYGNFYSFTVEERKRFTEIVIDENRGRVPVVCNCEHETLKSTIELMVHAENCGADFISLTGPRYGGNSTSINSVALEYFKYAASKINIGLVVDNISYVGYLMSPELMAQFADIPNVCMLKNVAPLSHTIKLRDLVGDRLAVIDPTEENLLVNMVQFGQKAVMNGTAMMYDSSDGTPMKDYVDAALGGDYKKAVTLYFGMQPLRDVYEKWVRIPWDTNNRMPLSAVKFWSHQLGLAGGLTRPPSLALSENDKKELLADLKAAGKIKK